MQRHIDDYRVEQNRKSQTQSYKGTQDPNALANNQKPKGGAAVVFHDAYRGSGYPGQQVPIALLLLPD